jgi:hypothetical protein
MLTRTAPAAASDTDTVVAPPPPRFELYDAVTRSGLGRSIRRLPASVQRRLRARLDGIPLPLKEKHRSRFLGALADLTARLLEPGRIDAERVISLMCRGGYRDGIVRAEVAALEKVFELVRDVAMVSMRSAKPADYVLLVSRPGVDVQRFVSTMWFFAGDRRVEMKRLDMEQRRFALLMERLAREGTARSLRMLLSLVVDRLPRTYHDHGSYGSDWRILQAFDVTATMVRNTRTLSFVLRTDHGCLFKDRAFFQLDELQERLARARDNDAAYKYAHAFLIGCGIYLTEAGKMLRFGRMFKQGPIEGYVVLKPERLRSYGYEAMTSAAIDDPTALLACEREHTLQHELQHVFDKIIYVESALRTFQDGTGETRRNLLAMEYRARLAEMAFPHDLSCVEDAMGEVRDNIALEYTEGEEMLIRVEADRKVYGRMGRYQRGHALQRVARKLLDQAYRQAYGLTYSQIVEPFAHTARASVPVPC